MPRDTKHSGEEARRACERAEQDAEEGYAEEAKTQGLPVRLQRKKETVLHIVFEAVGDLSLVIPVDNLDTDEERLPGGDIDPSDGVEITLSRDGVSYMGVCHSNRVGATADDWNRVLSEGLGTTFTVNWGHTRYSAEELHFFILGEPIFDVMRSQGFNPEWDGTQEGDFTIKVVDGAGAKLAVAMALHSRLGADSPLSLVRSLTLVLRRVVVYRGTSPIIKRPPS